MRERERKALPFPPNTLISSVVISLSHERTNVRKINYLKH